MVWYTFYMTSKVNSEGVDQCAYFVKGVRRRRFWESAEEFTCGDDGFL